MNQTISGWLKAAPGERMITIRALAPYGESDDGVFAPSDDQAIEVTAKSRSSSGRMAMVRLNVPPELLDHGGDPLARILLTNIELSIEAMEHGNPA
jgi:hypothetical protein